LDKEEFKNKIKEVTNPLPGSIPYSFTYTKSVKLKDQGKTVLEFYSDAFPHKAKFDWQKRIESGKILINYKKVNFNTVLKAGWITQHTINNIIEPKVNTSINLIYEDQNIIVINKPAPLPVHASGRFNKNTLIYILKQAFVSKNHKIVHRLDANTTGLLVLAKNKLVANKLIIQFQKQQVNKTYLAIVEGKILNSKFDITSGIGTEKQKSGSRKLSKNGIQAKTQVTVLKYLNKNTLVELNPKSGKTNQLRLHLASIGHPIVGDLGYKNPKYFKNNPMTYANDILMLHAYKLEFYLDEKKLAFIADIPDKFNL
jgi:23S rRNA pseudouridine1911/1915/1917 synthase